jgi:hypothetical protein
LHLRSRIGSHGFGRPHRAHRSFAVPRKLSGEAWVRSPGGVETQLALISSWGLRLLKDDGEVAFNALERASPRSPAKRFAKAAAEPIYIGRTLHVMLGASLFRVN